MVWPSAPYYTTTIPTRCKKLFTWKTNGGIECVLCNCFHVILSFSFFDSEFEMLDPYEIQSNNKKVNTFHSFLTFFPRHGTQFNWQRHPIRIIKGDTLYHQLWVWSVVWKSTSSYITSRLVHVDVWRIDRSTSLPLVVDVAHLSAHILVDTPTCDVRRGRFAKWLVTANHTHAWCYNMSPLN